jgi:hypothetical protein
VRNSAADCPASRSSAPRRSTRPTHRALCYALWCAALARLIEIDRAHGTLSGPATKKLAERVVKVYGQTEFAALAGISVSHLYNDLRKSLGYVKARVHFTATTAPRTPATIGVRKRPDPQGRAGFLRVASVQSRGS